MATQSQGASAPIVVESLSVITWQQQPVITTELLAQLYGTRESNIHDNFRNNAARFEAGKHFVKLTGAGLREFVNLQPENFRSQISSKVRSLILWTERGAARHAKMLDTEQAWDVFEKLEDYYFAQAKTQPLALPAPKIDAATHSRINRHAWALAQSTFERYRCELTRDIERGHHHGAVEDWQPAEYRAEFIEQLEASAAISRSFADGIQRKAQELAAMGGMDYAAIASKFWPKPKD